MNRRKNTGRRAARGVKPDSRKNKTGAPGKELKGKPQSKKEEKVASAPKRDDGAVRLNRFIANAGVCSRREAEKFITAGVVSINGKIVTDLSTQVKPNDDVLFNGASLNPQRKVYVLLNKPKDYVISSDDPYAVKKVADLVAKACRERIFPVGRIDRTTTGLLLFSNDGDLAEKLTSPKSTKKKIYQVTLDKNVQKEHLEEFVNGIELEDGKAFADEVGYVEQDDKRVIGIEIHSAKNRLVCRMFEHFGYKVRKLDRVYYAGLTKKNLPRGKYRHLSHQEVIMLKRGLYD
jgi:23S rRNA pseudouridine2605 synthase